MNPYTLPAPLEPAVAADRRRSPRLPVVGEIHVESVTLSLPLRLCDFSRTGFAVQGAAAFPTGVSHQFRFVTTGGLAVLLHAKSVHVSRARDGEGSYRTGFEFLAKNDPPVARAVDMLIKHVRASRPAGTWPS